MPVNIRSSSTHVRIDPEVKAKAMTVLNELHLSLGDYISMALTSLTLERGIPFQFKIPPASFAIWEDFEKDVDEVHSAIENGTARVYKSAAELSLVLEDEYD